MAKQTTWRSIEELLSRAKGAGIKVPSTWQAGYDAFTALAARASDADRRADRTRGGHASRAQADAVLKAALAGEKLPTYTEVAAPGLEADEDAERASVAAGIFRVAQDRALAAVTDGIEAAAEPFTTDQLAPAMAALAEKVTKLAAKLDVDHNDTRAVLKAGEATRRAWEGLDECGRQYRALRAVQRDIRTIAGWPSGRFSLLERPRKPDESETQLDRVILDVEAGAWCPIPAQEAALEAAERERVRAARPKPLIPSSRWGAAVGG